MPITQWDPSALPTRPGLYVNFKDAALAQIAGGARGTVAMPLHGHTGTAVDGNFYEVENLNQANELFGAGNVDSISLAFQGGANKVLVYAVPDVADYDEMREAFEAYQFNVFVWDAQAPAGEDALTQTWLEQNVEDKKLFLYVTGGSAADDQTPATGNSRSTTFDSDFIVNLIVGGFVGENELGSGDFAPYIAGAIAGSAINESLTYAQVALDDVNKRLRNSEVVTALAANSLVLVNDGEKVKIESAVTTSGLKIRSSRARVAIATDIEKTARDNYIGRVNNDEDGQYALISAIKVYLETLEQQGVLTDIQVTLDPVRPSVGDQVFLAISYRELDSMERVFLTVSV